MSAVIRIDQTQASGTSTGITGTARNDLWKSRLIALISTTGDATPVWSLLARPPSSSAALTGATTSTATFTPDQPGTYRIQLTVLGGGGSNTQILVARVRFDFNGNLINQGLCLPAPGELLGESNYNSNDRGWDLPHEDLYNRLIATPRPINDIASLRTETSRDSTHVWVKGYYTEGDGGEGEFYWDSSSTTTDNSGSIIQATGISTGRWRRLHADKINVRWFGAKGNITTDDRPAIQSAIDYAYSTLLGAGSSDVATIYTNTAEVYFPAAPAGGQTGFAGAYSIGRRVSTYGAIGFYHGLEVPGFVSLIGDSSADGPVIMQHSSVAPQKAITAATNATPVVISVANHGFHDGQIIEQRGVHGNTSADGRFVVTSGSTNAYQIYYQSGQPVSGNGAFVNTGTPVAYDSGIALAMFQQYKNRFKHLQFFGGRHALKFYGYSVTYGFLGSTFNPASVGSRIEQCSFLNQNGYSIWHDMTPVTVPGVIRSTEEIFIEDCKHVGPHFFWGMSDHLEIAGGVCNFSAYFIANIDVTRSDANFPELGYPDGMPLPYICNPDNTWVHGIMLENLGAGGIASIPYGAGNSVPLFGPSQVSISDMEEFDSSCVIMRTKATGNGYKGAGGEHTIPLGLYGDVAGFLHMDNVLFDNVQNNFIEVYDTFPTEIKISNCFGLNAINSNGIWVYKDPAGNKTITSASYDGTTVRMTVPSHGYSTNDVVVHRDVVGPAATLGSFRVVKVDADHYQIYHEYNDIGFNLDAAYVTGGLACRSGHVDLDRLLRMQSPVGQGAGTGLIGGTQGFIIHDDSIWQQSSLTRIRYGSTGTLDVNANPLGVAIDDRLEANWDRRPYQEYSSHFGPRNNLFIRNIVDVGAVTVGLAGAPWASRTDTSKGYNLTTYFITGSVMSGSPHVGQISFTSPAWGATMPAGIYTFLWDARTNFSSYWHCRFQRDGQALAGGLIRSFGPNDDLVQYGFPFYHPGGGSTIQPVIDTDRVPDGGEITAGNWMIVKGRAPNGVPYTMPVDDPVHPTTNIVSTKQPQIYFTPTTPTSGTYPNGAIIINTTPTISGNIGWVVTTGNMGGGSASFGQFGKITNDSTSDAYTFTGLTGSLQKTQGGLSYLVGAGGIAITSQSNGQIIISGNLGATILSGDVVGPASASVVVHLSGSSNVVGVSAHTIQFAANVNSGSNNGPTIMQLATSGRTGYDMHIRAQNTDPSNIGGGLFLHSGRGFDSNGIKFFEDQIEMMQLFSEGGNPIMVLSPAGGSSFTIEAPTVSFFIQKSGDYYIIDSSHFWMRSADQLTTLAFATPTGFRLSNDVIPPVEKLEVSGNVVVQGRITASLGFSGSLTRLTDATSYIVAGNGMTVTSASNGQVTLASQNGVTLITGSYTILRSDQNIIVNQPIGGAPTITLPGSPVTGDNYSIIDGIGNATTQNITINGNGKNIIGNTTQTLSTNYASITVLYNGVAWSVK